MTSKHTQEPWTTYDKTVSSAARANVIVADCLIDKHDADRIVACVNAMQGVDDPEAFMAAFRSWYEEVGSDWAESFGLADVIKHLKGID